MVKGVQLAIVLTVLVGVCAVLCGCCWRAASGFRGGQPPAVRNYLTVIGFGVAAFATFSLFALHITWLSPSVSQHLGNRTISVLSGLTFWSTGLALILLIGGSGKIRFLGLGASLAIGCYYSLLVLGAGLSGSTLARHPTKYFIPEGYVGWVEVRYGEEAPALELSNGAYVCRIPATGILSTSSRQEDGWAKDGFFYFKNDSLAPLHQTIQGRGGMIWAETTQYSLNPSNSPVKRFTYRFYVGTERQLQSEGHHPVSQP